MRTSLLCPALAWAFLVAAPLRLFSTTYDLASQADFDNFNPAVLVPGDMVRLARGITFYGQLDIGTDNITITAYGTGDDPVISGEKLLTGWTACTSGCPASNTWYASLSQAPNAVFINGTQATLARYPDSGYRTLTAATSTTLTDASLTYNPGWTGAGIHIRTSNWTWENKTVTGYNATDHKFTFSPSVTNTPIAGFAYYLDNLLSELDADNEWFYEASPGFKLYLKLPADPSGYTVTASIYDYGINCGDDLSGISISNIRFQRQKRHGVQMAGASASGNSITGCTFDGQYEIGANLSGSGITVSNCTFQNQNGRAIHAEDLDGSTISGNTLNDIGQVPGYGTSGDAGLAGIAIYGGTNNTVASNQIDNIGYIGIIFDCDNSTCEYNLVSNCMTKTSDGAGIKSYGPNSHHNVIRRNVVSACNGDPDTTPFTDFLTSAIYLDFYCHDNRIDSNLIYDQPKAGIQINKDNTFDTIRGNVVFGSQMGIMFLSGLTGSEQIENCHVRRNVFYTLQTGGAPVLIANMGASGLPGSLDSNYYCNPWQDTAVLRRLSLSNYLDYNLSEWQSASGQDAHTTGSYYTWTPPDTDAVLYKNETTSSQSYSPSGCVDLDDNPVSTFTLPAYYGKVVIQTLILAVEWLAPLRATAVPQGVLLEWSTEAEENNAWFQVERSDDARFFEEIGKVEGKGTGGFAYSFLDAKPLPGMNYYRLKQLDYDGGSEYSNVVSVDLAQAEIRFTLFPNPATQQVRLSFNGGPSGKALVTLHDLAGRKIQAASFELSDSGDFQTEIDLENLPAGVYLVGICTDSGQWQKKLVVK
ncbi:MAG: right-handed parallel beta-helix repeat-containing protein [Bacteroidetes bacterium]|nr:right-handed parallel beta-helix repeat-containing protein [Bacteroidota bacterium]